jgi:hypothetical protein
MNKSVMHTDADNLIPYEKKYAGEWNKKVNGKAKREMFCDICNKPIEKGQPCCAESMGLDSTPYYEWENEFIEADDKCPECGAEIRAKGLDGGGGVECTKCHYWFCY